MELGERVAVQATETGRLMIGTLEQPWSKEEAMVRFGPKDIARVHVRNLMEISQDAGYDELVAVAWSRFNVHGQDLGHRLLSTERVSGVQVSVYAKDGQLFLAGNGESNLRRVGP